MSLRLTHPDAEQGRSEERTEIYLTYFEGVPQLLTQLCAGSASGATS
jgi:hypothetical protein